jgi:multidrug resistance efflux pump
MIWKPVVVGTALLAAAGSAAAVWFNWPGEHKELRLPGTVETQEVRLSSRVGGRVARIFVKESQLASAGQKILELEMPELDAQRAQLVAQREAAAAVLAKLEKGSREEEKAASKAALDVAQARLNRMTKGYRTEEKEQARSELAAVDAEVQRALADLNRERALLATKASTVERYDSASSIYSKLAAQQAAASAKLRMLESGYREEEVAESQAELNRLQANYDLILAGNREEDKQEQRAEVAKLDAQINEIDVKRAERTVFAPEKAVVEVLMMRPGDIAAPNQAVALVLRADDLWVKAYISEVDLGKIQLGQQIFVTCDSFPGKRFEGEITHIASAAEFTPRNVQTIDERRHQVFGFKVRVADSQGVFKSGMAADVWLTK